MKPAAFDFVRAGSVAEATRMLITADGAVKVVAGAQSLGPMLNLRLVQPRVLVDITGIPALTRVEEDDEAVTLGACITTGNIEDGRLPNRGLSMLSAVAMRTAYRAVRNRGTIGGSVCHADPAADWVSALCALGAQCLIAGPAGAHCMPIEQFVVGAFETALGPGELLEAIRIPRLSPGGRWGYNKLCRRMGEFALAIGAVLSDPARERFRAVIGATGGKPIIVTDARLLGHGGSSTGDAFAVDEAAVLRLLDQAGVVDPVARRQHVVVLQRAFDQAVPL
ncbi:MAG TPA: FAD binding domain-containing protein [Phycisphaerae bacterium]|jgi:carbon-monoxide dehydrogenase medium subunit